VQFLDVTAEYFHSTGAELIFCTKAVNDLPPKMPKMMSSYAETSIDGADVTRIGNFEAKS
jgi:hypothetical protein